MRRLFPAVLSMFLAAGLLAGPFGSAEPTAAEPAAPPSTFTAPSPVRVLDTRSGGGPVGAGATVTLDLASRVPPDATAVVLNVTGVGPTANTHVIVFPAGTPRPTASNLNLPPGDTRANQVTVTLGTNRSVSLYNNAGTVHLVVDLTGYYSTGNAAKFTPLPPRRALDTRENGGPVGPGGTRVLDLTGAVPASATAVTFNLTATGATGATFVTAWPTGTSRPNASSLNLPAGATRPNLVTVAVGAGRQVSLYNNAGSVDLVVDVTGFYTPEYGNVFVPHNPKRVLDTRNGTGTGGSTSPLGEQGRMFLDLAAELLETATGVVLNVTGVDATAATYVTTWAAVGEVPNTSTLNLTPGQTVPNAAMVAFTDGLRQVQFYNNSGNVHLVADLAGVFVLPSGPSCTTDCVYEWGQRAAGVTWSPLPTRVVGQAGDVRAVAASGYAAYVLRADGTVWAWGRNGSGELGNGWTTGAWYGGSAVPVPVLGLSGVTAIAARGQSAYALRSDGTVWAWGDNFFGALGDGSRTNSSVPVRVAGLTDVVAIAAGDSTGYAVRADGTVWSWGFNGGGHLGNGTDVEFSATPVQVSGLTGVTEVAGGGHSNGTYALRSDGTVWAWGYNFAGALGTGQPCVPGQACLSNVPVQVSGLTSATAVASGVYHGMALLDDGTVWAWGSNDRGILGNGTTCGPFPGDPNCQSYVPVRVANLSAVTQIAAFYAGGYALRADGSVYAWGRNSSGLLGNDTVTDFTTVPVRVMGLPAAQVLGSGGSAGYVIVPVV